MMQQLNCTGLQPSYFVLLWPMAENLTPQEAGAKVKRLRERKGWRALELAERIRTASLASGGVEHPLTQQAVSKFENGGLKSIPRWFDLALRLLGEEAPLDPQPVRTFDGVLVSEALLTPALVAVMSSGQTLGWTAKEAPLLARGVLELLPALANDPAIQKKIREAEAGKRSKRPRSPD